MFPERQHKTNRGWMPVPYGHVGVGATIDDGTFSGGNDPDPEDTGGVSIDNGNGGTEVDSNNNFPNSYDPGTPTNGGGGGGGGGGTTPSNTNPPNPSTPTTPTTTTTSSTSMTPFIVGGLVLAAGIGALAYMSHKKAVAAGRPSHVSRIAHHVKRLTRRH